MMTNMENIIKKAIEGGYYGERADMPISHTDGDCSLRLHGADYVSMYEMICDPLFWQALGKACGWKELDHCPLCLQKSVTSGWGYHALHFHEINLTEGWEKAVEYLQEIIK